jgi:Na+/H+-dicarboxylate symporter
VRIVSGTRRSLTFRILFGMFLGLFLGVALNWAGTEGPIDR